MALKEVTGSNAISIGEAEVGATWKGYYLGPKTIPTKFGDKKVHTFQPRNGEPPFEVWGTAKLDRKLSSVGPRSWTQIEYLGKAKDGRGQSLHDVRVHADDDDRLPMLVDDTSAKDEIPF